MLENDKPLVSICICCYNHAKYLASCFDSIIDQTYQNIEVIIGDDCSKDDSVKIIESYQQKLTKRFIRYVFIKNEVNLGIVKNVNQVIKKAQGDYIKLFASDDIMLNRAIESYVDILENNREYSIVFGNAYIIQDDYKYNDRFDKSNRWYMNEIPDYGDGMFEKLMGSSFICAPSVLIRKNVYEKHGLHDENMVCEDYEFWLRISRYEKFKYVNEPLVCHRRGETSITNFRSKEGKQKFIYISVGEKQILKKYIKYIDVSKRNKYVSIYYNKILKQAMENNFLRIALRIHKIMEKNQLALDKENEKAFKNLWTRFLFNNSQQ
jgi:glycosyltransferase involved in cell wall biosynthesis